MTTPTLTYTVHLYQLDHLGARFRHAQPDIVVVPSNVEYVPTGVEEIARAGIDLPLRDWIALGRPGVLELEITPANTPSPYRVGDPDPTPNLPMANYCTRQSPGIKHQCTWGRGHHGDHVAGDGQIILAVWPNDDDPALAEACS